MKCTTPTAGQSRSEWMLHSKKTLHPLQLKAAAGEGALDERPHKACGTQRQPPEIFAASV
jgi:hypothetical protein